MRRRILVAAALAAGMGAATLAAALVVASRGPKTAPEQIAAARALERQIGTGEAAGRPRRVDRAVAALDKVATFEDRDGAHEAALREAMALLAREGRRKEAEVRARQLLARDPPPEDHVALRMRIGEWREASGDFEGARRAYLELVEAAKDAKEADEAAFRAGVILEDRLENLPPGDVLETWEAFARDYPKSPHAPEALLRLANLYRKLGEREMAVTTYRRIADGYPDSEEAARALREIGIIYGEELDKPKEAAKAFKELDERYGDRPAGSGARAMREKAEGDAAEDEEEEYRDSHYGGEPADLGDLIARTPREMLAELIAMRLDLRHLEADARLAPAGNSVEVDARLEIAHEGERARRDLDLILDPVMSVAEATWDGAPVEAAHEGPRLHVSLPGDWAPGEPHALRVRYGNGAATPTALVLGEDGFAAGPGGWVPATVVGDVFTCRSTFRVPAGTSVVATGAAVPPPAAAAGEATFAFSTGKDPVFGLYFAYGKFRSLEGEWRGRRVSIHWLDPDFEGAKAYLDELRSTLDFYSDRFGEAPWPSYAVVETRCGEAGAAGIGPATMLFLFRAAFAKGASLPRNLMAHELAHQWWGNLVPVTLVEGYAPWLSEGVASYSDALYLEHREGAEAARRHLTKFAHLYYDQVLHTKDRSLADAWMTSRIYRAVAYEKGARVLHLLRRTVGDEAFFGGLKRYATDFRYRPSTIDDFRRCFERTSGEDLSVFFDDWVKRPGFPHLVLRDVQTARRAGGGEGAERFAVAVSIAQVGERFRIPRLTVLFEDRGGRRETRTVAVERLEERHDFELPFEPARAVLDPDDDVLKHPGRDNEWTIEIAAERARRRGGGEVGERVPAAVFRDPAGAPIEIDREQGSVVLLFFYATGASACSRALPEVDGALRALGPRGLRAFAVSLEDAPAQARFAAALGSSVPVAVADEDALALFGGIPSVPAILILDRAGVVRAKHVGLRAQDLLEADIVPLLDEPAPPAAGPTR